MKSSLISILVISLLSVACAGESFTTSEEANMSEGLSEDQGGTGGTETEGGEQNGSSEGSETGEGAAASTGGTDAGGTGGVVSTGSGGDRTGGGETCVPKECGEVNFEINGKFETTGEAGDFCGGADDGCGGVVTCGCNEVGACGKERPDPDACTLGTCGIEGMLSDPNVCGGGCMIQYGFANQQLGPSDYEYYTCPTITSETAAAEFLGLSECVDDSSGRMGYYCK